MKEKKEKKLHRSAVDRVEDPNLRPCNCGCGAGVMEVHPHTPWCG